MKKPDSSTKNTIYATARPHPSHLRRQKLAALWVGLGVMVIILPLILISGTIIYFQVNDLNLPYVFIHHRDVGLVSRDETEALIDRDWNQNRTLQLVVTEDPAIHHQFLPQDLGIWIDPQATAQAAYAVGRSSQPFDDLLAALQGQPRVIMPLLYYDQDRARETLESLAGDLYISPVDASVIYQEGRWVSTPGSDGQAVDVDAALEYLIKNPFAVLQEGTLPLHLQSIAPGVVDLTPILGNIETLVSKDISLAAYDPIMDQYFNWSVPLEVKTSWVTVEAQTYHIEMEMKNDDVETLLSDWAVDLGQGRSFEDNLNSTEIITSWQAGETPLIMVYHDPSTYLVSQGESLWSISLKLGFPLWFLLDANPGINMDSLAVGMELNIPSRNVLLPLPAVMHKRIVVDISQQRMIVYENGQVRNTHIVSTGVADSPTLAGVFQVQYHNLNAYASNWDLYMPHFIGIYEAWPGFMNGIHGLPMLSSGRRLWAGNLGTPVSYGCIILALDAAEDLYHWAELGVVVEIKK